MMKFKNLKINPAKSPAILDTATWDTESALQTIQQLPEGYLEKLRMSACAGQELANFGSFIPYAGSSSKKGLATLLLAGLPDGQQIFIEFLPKVNQPLLGEPLDKVMLSKEKSAVFQKVSAKNIHRFFREVNPAKGPKAMGCVPRLGIGVRMTTACWPGIIEAMLEKAFKSNMIQNSVRELNVLSTLLDARPPEKNYACGFGTIETGYTGSSYEGLWVSGVLEALKHPSTKIDYGADADHIQVKRGPEGIAMAKRIIDASKYYTFYTIDMADILDYSAISKESLVGPEECLSHKISTPSLRKEVINYHRYHRRLGERDYKPDLATVGRFVGKYWDALEVMEELTEYLTIIKEGESFDLEFTIDEHPPEISAFDWLTTDDEIVFVLLEIKRRGLPVTHIAPNFGVEKGVDYRCPDGLEGLERRLKAQFHLAEGFGVMLDIHSGDDLTTKPRRVIQKASGGWIHFKISPALQILYAEVLRDFYPDLFQQWWNDAMVYARAEAAAGSQFAKVCIKEYEENNDKMPSHRNMVFHHYSFAFVGRRDQNGQFLHREEFYDLSPAFYEEYQNRLVGCLVNLANELF